MYSFTQKFGPNLKTVVLTVFSRQYHVVLSNKVLILSGMFLFITSLLVISFMLQDNINTETQQVFEILFIIYSVTLSSDLIIVEDNKNGVLEQFVLSGIMLEWFLLAKTSASSLIYILLYIPVLILTEAAMGYFSINDLCYSTLLKILIIANVVMSAALSSSFLLSSQKRISQILISMFSNIPVFIISILCYRSGTTPYMLLLVAMFLINFTVSTIISGYLIRVSIEES
ncbi:hypothetical protein [Candidatus Bandiella euplotis]|uniref:Heme exporter protein B n=1 Tax=Candidatus Bandiella euplotis TaxID=1664265 RepID=A0ABZ0UQ83_9RICK|nr:hypothetical protein [Candidatus Bandiella woodruffii]WPX97184.1 hypothetical protein Bandiella_01328 [Candidatus Bandiella woodruffii]